MSGAAEAASWLEAEGFTPPPSGPTAWVGSVLPAALWTVAPDHPLADQAAAEAYGLAPANAAIVLMIDGLGAEPLAANFAYARNLRRLSDTLVVAQTTVPSTTAAALTAFTTGALPGQTRMVGYEVRSPSAGERAVSLLNFEPGMEPEAWQGVPTLMERLEGQGLGTAVITKPKFQGSGLTRASFRGGQFVGVETLEDRLDAALRGVREGRAFQIVYWSDIDHAGHGHGVGSPKWGEKLEELDSALARFLARVPSGATVLLTADHGMVNVEERIDVAEVPQLRQDVPLVAGEGRAVHLHATDGQGEAAAARWADFLGERAVVVPQGQIAELIGPGPGCEEMGAAMVFMRGRTVVLDSRRQKPSVFQMKGVHGSLTTEEMAIPVWRLA